MPVWWAKQAHGSTVCRAQTENAGLQGNCPGSVIYLRTQVGRAELAKYSFNIKTTKLFMSALKP